MLFNHCYRKSIYEPYGFCIRIDAERIGQRIYSFCSFSPLLPISEISDIVSKVMGTNQEGQPLLQVCQLGAVLQLGIEWYEAQEVNKTESRDFQEAGKGIKKTELARA